MTNAIEEASEKQKTKAQQTHSTVLYRLGDTNNNDNTRALTILGAVVGIFVFWVLAIALSILLPDT